MQIFPSSRSTNGGSSVTITLNSFNNTRVAHCRFKDVIVIALASTNSQYHVICMSPKQKLPGKVSLEVSINGVDFIPSNTRFLHATYWWFQQRWNDSDINWA